MITERNVIKFKPSETLINSVKFQILKKIDKAPSALRTIGEVSKIIDVPVYVIRFWETKFTSFKSYKKNNGNRLQ